MALPIPHYESAPEKGSTSVPRTTDPGDVVRVGSDILFW